MTPSLPSQPILMKSATVRTIILLIVLSSGLTLLFSVLQLHYGFSLWDEGFLWYGVKQVMQGAVPLRDFMSYDPGRYYLTAGLMSLWGSNSLLSLRWAMAILEVCTVTGVLLIIRSFSDPLDPAADFCASSGVEAQRDQFKRLSNASARPKSPTFWLGATLTLLAWIVPYFKVADFLACMLLLGGLSYLIRNPNRVGHLVAGLCVGLAAVLGRNHGVYGALASFGVVLWLRVGPGEKLGLVRGCLYGVIGITVGFSPVLLMMALIPGFATAMWETVRLMFEFWRHQYPEARTLAMAHQPCSPSIPRSATGYHWGSVHCASYFRYYFDSLGFSKKSAWQRSCCCFRRICISCHPIHALCLFESRCTASSLWHLAPACRLSDNNRLPVADAPSPIGAFDGPRQSLDYGTSPACLSLRTQREVCSNGDFGRLRLYKPMDCALCDSVAAANGEICPERQAVPGRPLLAGSVCCYWSKVTRLGDLSAVS